MAVCPVWCISCRYVLSTTRRSFGTSANSDSSAVSLAFQAYESTHPVERETSPVFIMHGLLGSKSNWSSLSKSIHHFTKRKVVSMDARNHGESPHASSMGYDMLAADVRKLMQDSDVPRASLVGHSMGGKTMMTLALQNPEVVSSLLVVDIAPCTRPAASSDIPAIVDALSRVQLTEDNTQWAARQRADKQLQTVLPDKYLRQFLLTNLVEMGGEIRWRVNLEAIRLSLRGLSQFLHEPGAIYNGPTLFVGGQNSTYIDPADQDSIRALFPSAQFVWIPGAGHWVHSEKPTEFLDVVCPFLMDAV